MILLIHQETNSLTQETIYYELLLKKITNTCYNATAR